MSQKTLNTNLLYYYDGNIPEGEGFGDPWSTNNIIDSNSSYSGRVIVIGDDSTYDQLYLLTALPDYISNECYINSISMTADYEAQGAFTSSISSTFIFIDTLGVYGGKLQPNNLSNNKELTDMSGILLMPHSSSNGTSIVSDYGLGKDRVQWNGKTTTYSGISVVKQYILGIRLKVKDDDWTNTLGANIYMNNVSFTLGYDAKAQITFQSDGNILSRTVYDMDSSVDFNYNTLYKVGYEFSGWQASSAIDNSFYPKNQALPACSNYDVTYTAVWTPKILKIDLTHNTTVDSSGTTSIYLKYSDGWYSDAAATNKITTLPKLPLKTGYNFQCYFKESISEWIVSSDGTLNEDKLTFTTEDTTLNSFWLGISYSICFQSNNGLTNQFTHVTSYDAVTKIPGNENNFIKIGYNFSHWNTKADNSGNSYYPGEEKVLNLTTVENEEVILYAIWTPQTLVSYDSIFSYFDWYRQGIKSDNACTIISQNDTGFTIKSDSNTTDGYSAQSPMFNLAKKDNDIIKKYRIDVDAIGAGWQLFIFFYKDDGSQAYYSNGYYHTDINKSGATIEIPPEATKASIRVDSNNANNQVTFSNFRIYPADYYYMGYSIPSDKASERTDSGSWSLPTIPVRNNSFYEFIGWSEKPVIDSLDDLYPTNGNFPTENKVLYSQWKKKSPRMYYQVEDVSGGKPILRAQLQNKLIKKAFIYITPDNGGSGIWKEV